MPQDTSNSTTTAEPVPRALSWRSVVLTVLLAAVLLGLPFAVNAFNLVHVTGFPLGFFMIAQVLPLLLAAIAMTAARHAFSPSKASGAGLPRSRSGGLAMAGVLLSPALAIVLFHGVYARGHDGLLPAYAVLSGIALWLMGRNWMVPASGIAKLEQTTAQAPGPTSLTPAIRFLAALCLVPLAAGHLIWFEQALHTGGAELLTVTSFPPGASDGAPGQWPWPSEPAFVAAIAAAVIAIALPARLFMAMAILIALLLVGGSLALAWSLQPAALSAPLAFADGQTIPAGLAPGKASGLSAPSMAVPPQLAYGHALAWIGLSEQAAVPSGLADPVVVKIFAKPFSYFNSLNASLSLVTYALGAAALSVIAAGFVGAARSSGKATSNPAPYRLRPRGWTGTHWAVFAIVVALVTFPAAGAYLKLMQYRTAGAEISSPPLWLQTASSHHLASLCHPETRSNGTPASEMTDDEGSVALSAPAELADTAAVSPDTSGSYEIDDPFAWSSDAEEAEPIDLEAVVDGILDTRHVCTGPQGRLAVNDITFKPGMLPVAGFLAAWQSSSAPLLSGAAKTVAGLHAALMFFGLVLVIRCVSAGPADHRRGTRLLAPSQVMTSILVATLALGLAGLMRVGWIERPASELPMLSLALLGAAIAPALLLNSLSRRPTLVAVAIAVLGGLALMAYDMLALVAPLHMLAPFEPLSNAPAWRWQEFSAIAEACSAQPSAVLSQAIGPGDAPLTGRACTAARVLAIRITNIAGLSTASMALPVAMIVFLLGAVLAAVASLVRGRS